MHILVVEDDRKTAAFIGKALRAEGFAVSIFHHGDEALIALENGRFDAAVLDIMLPGRDGLSIVRELRKEGNGVPVLLLSARGNVHERVEGLDAGADDYLSKPFVLEELVARVRALTRRGRETLQVVLQLADLCLDTTTHKANRGGDTIDLTAREYRLLEYLMRSAGRVCSRGMILENVWDYSFDPGSNIIDVYVRRLRAKVDEGREVKLLHSVRGSGYRLAATP